MLFYLKPPRRVVFLCRYIPLIMVYRMLVPAVGFHGSFVVSLTSAAMHDAAIKFGRLNALYTAKGIVTSGDFTQQPPFLHLSIVSPAQKSVP